MFMTHSEPGSASFYMGKWLLTPAGNAIQTATSSLFPVVRDGVPLMLKIIRQEGDEQNSCAALQHYNGQGAVKVFERTEDAFVMQRLASGRTLVDFRKESGDAETTEILADVVSNLHSASASTAGSNLPPLRVLREAFSTTNKINQNVLSRPMLMLAEAMFDKLIASTSHQLVLHSDLHHENVMFDSNDGWLAIDPKGFIGDPIYDCAALFKNPLHDDEIASEACIFSRAAIMHRRLGYPSDRILEWAYVHCVLSVIWSLQDGMPTGPALPVAVTLFGKLRHS